MQVDGSGRVWAMRPDPMGIAAAMRQREGDDDEKAVIDGQILEGSDYARLVDGVAVIPVLGMLMQRMSFWFWSYEEIQRDLELAVADERVEAILLDIDSPGGLAAGCADLATAIRAARQVKPVVAWTGSICASAAFMIGGSADRLLLGSGSIVGSVGTVIEYIDMEPYYEKLGAKIVRVVAEQSPNKRLDPDSEEGQAEMQALVDAGAAEFIAALAAGRGVSEATVLSEFGQGLVFKPEEVIRRGMADGKASFKEILAELAGREGESGAAPAAAEDEESPMDWASITSAGLREHRPELVEEIEAAAREAVQPDQSAIDAAVEAEHARLQGIDEVAVAGHEDLVAAAKKDRSVTPEALALQIVKAAKAQGADHLAARADADKAIGDVPAAPPPAAVAVVDETAPIEDRAKAEFANDPKIRAEFGSEDEYIAFRKAEDRGAARIKGAA